VSLLITLEGIEGCGNTTQCKALASYLRSLGHEVVETREPGGTDLTCEIRRLLADPTSRLDPRAELMLFLADRAQHVASIVRPALERGAMVVCDRYIDSTIAYQGHGRGHDPSFLADLNRWASYDVVPDLTLWIDCDIEIGLARARKGTGGPGDRFEAEPLDFHRAVRDGFARIQLDQPDRVLRIDGNLPLAEVTAAVIAAIDKRLA